jgi:hypothetical protein
MSIPSKIAIEAAGSPREEERAIGELQAVTIFGQVLTIAVVGEAVLTFPGQPGIAENMATALTRALAIGGGILLCLRPAAAVPLALAIVSLTPCTSCAIGSSCSTCAS